VWSQNFRNEFDFQFSGTNLLMLETNKASSSSKMTK
jgi:hypothetical protein